METSTPREGRGSSGEDHVIGVMKKRMLVEMRGDLSTTPAHYTFTLEVETTATPITPEIETTVHSIVQVREKGAEGPSHVSSLS